MNTNTQNLILASLSADAYLLGSHWIYDEEQLKNLAINWQGLNDAQAMWHKDKKAGDFTHYGDQTLFLLEYISKNKSFEKEDFYTFWSEKMSNYDGYIDGATRNALETIDSANSDLSICGRYAPLLLISQNKEEFLKNVALLTKITHNSELAMSASQFFAELLWDARESQDITGSIENLKHNYPTLLQWINDGIASKDDDTFTSIREFGPACGIDGGFAGVIHLLSLDDDFTNLMIKNAKAGGDSSARGMVVAMILATQDDFVMNDEWVQGMTKLKEIQSYL